MTRGQNQYRGSSREDSDSPKAIAAAALCRKLHFLILFSTAAIHHIMTASVQGNEHSEGDEEADLMADAMMADARPAEDDFEHGLQEMHEPPGGDMGLHIAGVLLLHS